MIVILLGLMAGSRHQSDRCEGFEFTAYLGILLTQIGTQFIKISLKNPTLEGLPYQSINQIKIMRLKTISTCWLYHWLASAL